MASFVVNLKTTQQSKRGTMASKRNSTSGPSASSDSTSTGNSGKSRTRKPKAGHSGKSGAPFEAAVPIQPGIAPVETRSAEPVIPKEAARPKPPKRVVSQSAVSAEATPAIVPAAGTESSPTVTVDTTISEQERIALLAYSFWEARGRQGGSPEDDWFRAERELRRLKEATAARNA